VALEGFGIGQACDGEVGLGGVDFLLEPGGVGLEGAALVCGHGELETAHGGVLREGAAFAIEDLATGRGDGEVEGLDVGAGAGAGDEACGGLWEWGGCVGGRSGSGSGCGGGKRCSGSGGLCAVDWSGGEGEGAGGERGEEVPSPGETACG
jgi:hypothetical protein